MGEEGSLVRFVSVVDGRVNLEISEDEKLYKIKTIQRFMAKKKNKEKFSFASWLLPLLIVLSILIFAISHNNSFGMIILFLLCLVLYLLPGIIAISKEKKNKVAILVLNILLGWTIIVWIVVLIWSLCND